MTSATMVVALPECDSNTGGYNPIQSQGELSWCVSPEGVPTPDSLTWGKVSCSGNGILLQKWAKGRICHPHAPTAARVCRDSCLTASCPAHPNALCVMDVCGDCAPTFFSPTSGERLRCEERCQQSPGDPGLCRASMLRHTYNATSGRCESFIWGGCGGNDNNFGSGEECATACEQGGPASLGRSGGTSANDICSLPPKPGPCRASMVRWYFNLNTQSCTQFDYGGCGGLPNNFMSKEQCESRCPDVILCPTMSMTNTTSPEDEDEGGVGSLKTCSRRKACAKAMESCPGYSVDDFLCRVDPCDCSASLEDFHGHPVNCSELMSSGNSHQSSSDSVVLEAAAETPPPSFYSEGEILKLRPGIPLPTQSRCQLMRIQGGSDLDCDEVSGKFVPRQCRHSGDGEEACFCVDDAGRRVIEGEDAIGPVLSCEATPISSVLVSLSLPGGEDVSSVQLGVEMQQMLHLLGAELQGDRVQVEILPGATQLSFTLTGDHNVDVSYWLESLLIASAIGVEDPKGVFHPASFATSSFTHVRASPVHTEVEDVTSTVQSSTSSWEEDPAVNEVPVDEDIVQKIAAQRHLLDSGGDPTVGILLTLVAAISAVLLVLALFLAGQKKKAFLAEGGAGYKKPFGGLGAFSSGLYEVAEKKSKKKGKKLAWREAVTIPTFRISPFVVGPPSSEDQETDSKDST